jgi:hypothetical protein
MHQEEWMGEVERQLREARDEQTLAKANTADIQIYSAFPPFFVDNEWQWIKLTSRGTANGEFFYAWDQMIREPLTATTYQWKYGGISGSLDAYPAIELNNSNLPVNDSTRYLARWNPDTSQWIFFLKRRGSGGVTDWPSQLTCATSISLSFSTNFNIPQGTSLCGYSTFSSLMESCTGEKAVIEAKLYASWKGIEKIIAWSKWDGCSSSTSTGYPSFGVGVSYPIPAPEQGFPVTIRWEITIRNSVGAFYDLIGPSNVNYYKKTNPCGSPGLPVLRGPDASVSGTNLTGSKTLAACANTSVSVNSVVTISASGNGPNWSPGTIKGFKVTIQSCSYTGKDNSKPSFNYEGSSIPGVIEALASEFAGRTCVLGSESGFALCSGTPSKTGPIGSRLFKVGGVNYSLDNTTAVFSGVNASGLYDDSLASTCTCPPNNEYLSSVPAIDAKWRGSNIQLNYFCQSYPTGQRDTNYTSVTGGAGTAPGIEANVYEALSNCIVNTGWSKTITGTTSWYGESRVGGFGGSYTVTAYGWGLISYTVKIEYLG